MLKVNGVDVSHCIGFVTDGCHKIYLCENQAQFDDIKVIGYGELCPMSSLEKTFVSSCPLRFISWADLRQPDVVPQCAESVEFEDGNGKRKYNFR